MDLSFGEESEAFRKDVKAFLADHWLSGASKGDAALFRTKATEAGYLYRAIPRAYGGSEQPADVTKAEIIRAEFRAVRAPMEIGGNGLTMVVPTLLAHGAPWQKEFFIPPTLRGEFQWAQGYSEPNAGSDLASLRARGELVNGEWVINGQKIWTSRAHESQYMFALVRTEPDAPKHAGISYLLIDLRQPGVTIRPLRQMTGRSEFCEVFLDDVRTPEGWIVGQRGEGWAISKTTLKHERATIGGSERTEEQFQKLVALARETERNGKPAILDSQIRQDLAELEGWILAQKYSGYRRFSVTSSGGTEGLLGLVNKQLTTEIAERTARIAQALIGDAALLQPSERSGERRGAEKWIEQIMGSLAVAIAGGASNIQRNIIAERGLNLPRDRGE
jgi:alkylation response protein AidB-like acyl-CoA dehydrogenase